MEANATFIRWGVHDIDRLFWYDQIYEGARYCEWIDSWEINWLGNTKDYFHVDIRDEAGVSHCVSSVDVLLWLRKAWMLGDRSFEEEQDVDQDVIDAMLQEICYGELVYG